MTGLQSKKTVIGHKFRWARPFSEGLACVGLGRNFGYVNTNGEMALSNRLIIGRSRFADGLAPVIAPHRRFVADLLWMGG